MLALESRLRRNVEVLAGEIGERHVGRPAALHSADSYIAAPLSELDFEVSRQTYIFYFGEMGSRVYARTARRRGDDIRVMLSLEMLGCCSDIAGSQRYPPLFRHFYPDAGNFIAFVSNLRSRAVLREVVSAYKAGSDSPAEKVASPGIVPGVSWSDQLSFWREGYAGVMVTDTAFYRYPHYHEGNPTLRGAC